MHDNTLDNLIEATENRVLTCKGQPLPQPTLNVEAALRKFKYKFLSHMPELKPYTPQEFVDSYTGRKRSMYQRELDGLVANPDDGQDATISPFVKDEKIDCYDGSMWIKAETKAPRLIQGRSPKFNISVGVYLKPFEKAAFKAVAAVFRGVTIVKGLNGLERASVLHSAWSEFKNPRALGVDARRFDAHCNSPLQNWTYGVEEAVFPELREYNSKRKTNTGIVRTEDGKLKYVVFGRLSSGDMDTASGGALKMCAVTWTVMDDIGVKYRYINDGDDGVIIVEAEDVDKVKKHFVPKFLAFGIQMEWEGITDVFEEIEFCQSQPVFNGSVWKMIRNPLKAMAKDSLTLRKPKSPEEVVRLRNANGWCGLSLAGDMPILGAFYWRMITGERPEVIDFTEGKHFLARGLDPIRCSPTLECRKSFERAFKISPDTQLALESYFNNVRIHDSVPTPVDVLREDPTLRILLTTSTETRAI